MEKRSSRPALVEQAATVFESYGADAWYERPTADFVPAGLTCPKCGGTSFEREMNILDVWFDSGSSHEAVLSVRPELTWPADIYLEGSDQHRGWFQSSLLVGLGTRGRAPFREVVTNGFVVADDGRKMSKSLGNSIEPQDIIKQSGADILRLWVAMSDYTQDVRLSKEILARVVEAYRKIRNTLRYLVARICTISIPRPTSSIGAASKRSTGTSSRGMPIRPIEFCGRTRCTSTERSSRRSTRSPRSI